MSQVDTAPSQPSTDGDVSLPMGTFDEEGNYIPRPIIENDLGGVSMDEAYTATMVDVDDGHF